MFWLRFVAFLVLISVCDAITCYDCPSGVASCTTTCTGAVSCAYQVNLPLMASNQQLVRCDYNVTTTGCLGSLTTQTVICYCNTDLCNKLVNSTLAPVGTGATVPQLSSTPGMMPNNLAVNGALPPSGVPTVPGMVTYSPTGAAVPGQMPAVNFPGYSNGVPMTGQPTVPGQVPGQGYYQQAVGGYNPTNYPAASYPTNYPAASYPTNQIQPQLGQMSFVTTGPMPGGRRRRSVHEILNRHRRSMDVLSKQLNKNGQSDKANATTEKPGLHNPSNGTSIAPDTSTTTSGLLVLDGLQSNLAGSLEECLEAINRTGLTASPTSENGSLYCNATFDNVLCWSATLANSSVTLRCPELKGLDSSKTITKFCHKSGKWAGKTDDDFSRTYGFSNFTECFTDEILDILKNNARKTTPGTAENLKKLPMVAGEV